MTFPVWMALAGGLLLALALSSAWIQRLPLSTAAIYLAVGFLIGPWGFGLLQIDFTRAAAWLERLTEISLILSLFVGGLRLRLPPTHSMWRPAYLLASVVMLASIAGVAGLAHVLLGVPVPLALLIGAILAPTDPVLAGSVTVGHAEDRDPLRYALSGEAGLNDGAAFPFVALALLLLAPDTGPVAIVTWALQKLVWAIPAGLAVGFVLGRILGSAAIGLRSRNRDTAAPTDFLALALMALSYTIAEALGAWGFLAVFAAGIGLRRAEILTVETDPHPDAARHSGRAHPPAETLVSPNVVTEKEMGEPAVAAGVLVAEVFSFGDTVERVLEVLLVILVGCQPREPLESGGRIARRRAHRADSGRRDIRVSRGDAARFAPACAHRVVRDSRFRLDLLSGLCAFPRRARRTGATDGGLHGLGRGHVDSHPRHHVPVPDGMVRTQKEACHVVTRGLQRLSCRRLAIPAINSRASMGLERCM